MALTIAKVTGADTVFGNKKVKVRTITFDSSYADNGESLTASDVGLRKIEQVIPNGPFRKSDGSDAIVPSYDFTNAKLLAFDQKDPGSAGGTDIAFPEVANTTDLSAYSGRVTFIGY